MIKSILIAALSIVIASVPITAFADNVTLYASLDDSNNIANLLSDLMRNDDAYDPYNQYVILRSGEREYKCYFGPDLDKSSVCLTYSVGQMGIPATLSRSIISSPLSINKNGYWCIGNVEGTCASQTVETYKTNYIIVIVALAIAIFFLFKIFKRAKTSGDRYYRVR